MKVKDVTMFYKCHRVSQGMLERVCVCVQDFIQDFVF